MQATNATPFSSQQTPYISPVRSFFQNEFTKKIAFIAAAIIGVLAILFLQEWGLPIVAVLAAGVFLASNTCLDDTAKVPQPTIAPSNTSGPSLDMPAYPIPSLRQPLKETNSKMPAYPEPQVLQKSEKTNSETCCNQCVDSCFAPSTSDNSCSNDDSCWDDDIHGTAFADCLSSLCSGNDSPMTLQSTTDVTFSRR